MTGAGRVKRPKMKKILKTEPELTSNGEGGARKDGEFAYWPNPVRRITENSKEKTQRYCPCTLGTAALERNR